MPDPIVQDRAARDSAGSILLINGFAAKNWPYRVFCAKNPGFRANFGADVGAGCFGSALGADAIDHRLMRHGWSVALL